jgi:tetratricopeptide (TPR) repeat protein
LKINKRAKSLIYLGVVFFIVASFSALGCASKEEKKAEHLKRAREYVAKNEFQKAVIEFKNVVQLDPKDAAAYVELGETYLKLRDTREAFQAFSTAAGAAPNNLIAQLKMGQMLLLGKQTEQARKKAELILQKSPDDIEGLSLLSGVQLQEKNLEGAIKTLEKASSIAPKHFNTPLSLGRLFLLKGEPGKAEEEYNRAISLDPTSSIPYIELSRIYASKGIWDRAEEELKKMIESSGASYHNLTVLALFYESAKKYDLAEKTYLQAVEAAPKQDVTPLMNLGAYYARMKSSEKALDALQKAAEIKPEDLNIQVSLAQLHLDFNQTKEAEATVDKVLSKEKGNVGANFLKGRLCLARKDYEGGLERFGVVVRESPKHAGAHYFRALCYLGKGERNLAQQDLLKAVDLNPGLFDARLILAELYLRDRNQDLAGQQIEAALKMAPRNVRALMLQGSLKLLQRDWKAAEEVYRKVIEIDPGRAPAYVELGVVYNLTGRQKEALPFFNKALDLNPRQTDALALVVAYYVREKKFDEALKVCEAHKKKVADNQANLAQTEYLQGTIFLANKDTNAAQERFMKAIDTEPNMVAPYLALAQIYVKEKKFDEAIGKYEGILAKNPKYLAGYMSVGTIYDLKGDGTKAETYYRQALKIKKDFGPAANNLAWNLADRGGNIDEALTYAQIAKEQMPDSAAVMDTLGWIYYLKRSYLNAIAEFQDSLARDPNNPVINYHMGLAQYKNDNKGKAREFLGKALELEPEFRGAEEARKILKEIKE